MTSLPPDFASLSTPRRSPASRFYLSEWFDE
ncbi:hypothetical protein BEI_0639 [Halomonas beimenensis]|uniref:Uncharacterized protein n=1 Tax=Halomonas beimenensis TaxID=475662 RepID=A0A291P409_9GAMM|nr:hypothetical protein BEI_0639 [Halomonas beimenensis]